MSSLTGETTSSASAKEAALCQCPVCDTKLASKSDKFCRSCGSKIILQCSKCNQSVRASDRFCPHCGAKRWYMLELWRNNAWEQSKFAKVGIVITVAAAWLALFALLRKR